MAYKVAHPIKSSADRTKQMDAEHAERVFHHVIAQLEERSRAFSSRTPEWWPHPTEWHVLWDKALKATR